MKKRIIILFFAIIAANEIYAQGCGPNCPACSGTIDGSLLAPKTLSVQGLYMPTADEEQGIANLRYGLFSWFDAGVGYAFNAQKIIWNARIQPVTEKEDGWRPGIVLGTGSIRAGESDQSFYLNLLKSKEFSENFAITASAGTASLASDMDKIYGIGNVSATFSEKYTVYANYDGINFHEGFAWTINNWLTTGFMMIESKYPSLTVSLTKSLF
ncbi:hypothetical protein [Gaoshiqia sp. Z1-71]|uniref:hypothetical protein n=1 Tax=Gaoshiqia hydrogeniformans TaxID=3290090 RepID=UPI003BF8428E